MNWLEILEEVCKVCLIPLLGALTGYAIKYLRTKEEVAIAACESELGDKYIAMFFDTVSSCVSATTQTYVDSLKASGSFGADAQKIAFEKTFQAVKASLTEDAKEYLATIYGDLDVFLTAKIEAEVKAQK